MIDEDANISQASSAVELCRPYLALSLTSAAASMVIALGYHRSTSVEFDTAHERDRKIFLFWMVYVFDSSFSVRLGRAPILRDADITIPGITYVATFPVSGIESFCYWIEVVKVQCQAVEQLYSPTALRQPLEERSNRAAKLAERLEEAWKVRDRVRNMVRPPKTYGNVADVQYVRLGFTSGRTARVFLFSLQSVGLYHALQHHVRETPRPKSDTPADHDTCRALLQHATMSSRKVHSPAIDNARHALKLTVEARKTHKGLPDYIWSAHCHW